MQNKFVKNKKAHDLYANKPLFKAILIVIIPSLAMTLMTGIYIFASQVIINRLVPIAHGSTDAANFQYWFNLNYDEVKNWCQNNGKNFSDVGDIVKGSMSIASPIATIIGSSPFFLAGGAGVLFTQAMGRQNKDKADQVFKTSFYMVLLMALLETCLLLILNNPILTAMSSPVEKVTDPQMQIYFQKIHDLQITFANNYTMIYSAGIVLPLLIFYFASLIKSEGRFKIVVITSIACNILNIGLIVIFILFAHLDMIGGALGSTVSYGINLSILIGYLAYLNRTNQTWLLFKLLFKPKLTEFKLHLVAPIILIGLSAFLIDISYAIANMFYIPILANAAQSIFPNAHGNGMYFQTIEGATMPILNLVFVTIYGIVDGERLIVAYNYSLGNWKRIIKTYRYTIFIAFAYAMIMVILLALCLGKPILLLFDITNNPIFRDAYIVLLIQLAMLPAFSFQAPAMSIYMSVADTIRSNIAAIFQDIITFFPILGICYGISMTTNNIWVLVATYVINASIASILMILYTRWWLKKRLGKVKVKLQVANKTQTQWIPTNRPNPTFIQKALERN